MRSDDPVVVMVAGVFPRAIHKTMVLGVVLTGAYPTIIIMIISGLDPSIDLGIDPSHPIRPGIREGLRAY